jgi:septal ring factor EnvC (AmiA/AmiB activator)
MGTTTDGLMNLRPVTFRYKDDPQAIKQYGLVAEEVEQVYPELVVHDEAGKVQSVRYSMLSSMLLNELQKETTKNEQQADRIAQLTANTASMQRQIAELKASNEQERAKRTAIEDRLSKLEQTIVAQRAAVKVQAAFYR